MNPKGRINHNLQRPTMPKSKAVVGVRVLINGAERHPDGSQSAPYRAPYTLAENGEDFRDQAQAFAEKRTAEGYDVQLVEITADGAEASEPEPSMAPVPPAPPSDPDAGSASGSDIE
jgi:hypothetical protein